MPRLTLALLTTVALACGRSGESTDSDGAASSEGSASTGGTGGDASSTGTPTSGATGTSTDGTTDPPGTSGPSTDGTTEMSGTIGTSTDGTTDTSGTTGGMGDGDPDPNAPPVTRGAWWRPGVATTWQLQLTGVIDVAAVVDLYDIDLFDAPPATIDQLHDDGRKVVCYFSAGSGEDWRPDHGDFDPAALGEPLDGWPGEVWLDVRHPSVWAVMRGRLDRALMAGCDGVDPDNMDGWLQDSGYPLTAADQLAYNRWIANQAHLRGLTVGLKNAGDQAHELVDYFDFELNEQCHEYEECEQLAPFTLAGKPIFNVEYPGDEADAQALAGQLCPEAEAAELRTLMLPYELDGSWRVSCD